MKKLLFGTILLALAGCQVYTTNTSEAPAAGPKLELSAWVVFWDAESTKSFEAHVDQLARIYPEYISCGVDGLPTRIPDLNKAWLPGIVKTAHAKDVKVLATMSNYATGDFDPIRVRKMLNDPALMAKHIQALIAIATEEGLDGLDVDYESLEAGDRSGFTAFVSALCQAAHAKGLLIGVALHPKESEPGNWGGPAAQDYAALGKVADFIHVMTYDNHWATSEAGSIAPPAWVRSVMSFTVNQIPKEKVEMGLNGYGYDWQGKKAETMTWVNWQKLLQSGKAPDRDATTKELKISYGNHEIWYPDALTFVPKIKIAKELGLRGGAMWVLGQEDPSMWRMWQVQR